MRTRLSLRTLENQPSSHCALRAEIPSFHSLSDFSYPIQLYVNPPEHFFQLMGAPKITSTHREVRRDWM